MGGESYAYRQSRVVKKSEDLKHLSTNCTEYVFNRKKRVDERAYVEYARHSRGRKIRLQNCQQQRTAEETSSVTAAPSSDSYVKKNKSGQECTADASKDVSRGSIDSENASQAHA